MTCYLRLERLWSSVVRAFIIKTDPDLLLQTAQAINCSSNKLKTALNSGAASESCPRTGPCLRCACPPQTPSPDSGPLRPRASSPRRRTSAPSSRRAPSRGSRRATARAAASGCADPPATRGWCPGTP
eukprot:1388448-Rhodomonas_salina.2